LTTLCKKAMVADQLDPQTGRKQALSSPLPILNLISLGCL
jgi:hypothetical protein